MEDDPIIKTAVWATTSVLFSMKALGYAPEMSWWFVSVPLGLVCSIASILMGIDIIERKIQR